MMTDTDKTEILRRYLLDQATEAEMADVELRFLSSDDAFEDIKAVEDELFYEYSANEMSAAERFSFEARFLSTAEGRDRLAFANALIETTAEMSQQTVSAVAEPQNFLASISAFLGLSKSVTSLGMAAVLLLIAAGLAFVFIQNRTARNDIAAVQTEPEVIEPSPRPSVETIEPSAGNSNSNNDISPTDDTNKKPVKPEKKPKKDQTEPNKSFFALVLTPGYAVRSDGSVLQPVKLTPSLRTVGLLLKLIPIDDFISYRAEVREVDTGKLIASSPARAMKGSDQQTYKLTVPARNLKQADYEAVIIGVKADGTSEEYSTYFFSARK
jgi:hypothetical protein